MKYFYTLTLKREGTSLKFIRPGKEKKLPVILSRQEVKALFDGLRSLNHRACPGGEVKIYPGAGLKVIYSQGLRIEEGTNLHPVRYLSQFQRVQVAHIDSERLYQKMETLSCADFRQVLVFVCEFPGSRGPP